MALFLVDQGIKMIEKEITKFEKEILLQGKISQLENELKEFSDLQKKVYSERLQKSIVGLENRIKRIKKMLYKT
ncbi:hypothetical protein [Kaistella sp.]